VTGEMGLRVSLRGSNHKPFTSALGHKRTSDQQSSTRVAPTSVKLPSRKKTGGRALYGLAEEGGRP
jgi:hypothetical protein